MPVFNPNTPTAEKVQTKADIVFGVDGTSSMTPCIKAVKASLDEFAASLQTAADVHFRLRLIVYRDLQTCNEPIEEHAFGSVGDAEAFRRQLADVEALGGGPPPESTPDAIIVGAHSEWREQCHRAVIILTDSTCYPELDSSTCRRFGLSDGHISRVIDALVANRIQLFLVGPDFEVYRKLDAEAPDVHYQIVDDPHSGLVNVDFKDLLEMFGRSISHSSMRTVVGDDQDGEEEL